MLFDRWVDSGQEPDGAGVLSSGEYSTLLLAVGEESSLSSPLSTFLHLEPHLQKFILDARRLKGFIGRRIADLPDN
jgi:hypothetical protein